MQLRRPPVLLRRVHESQGLSQHTHPCLDLSCTLVRLGQHGKPIWESSLDPHGPPSCQALVHLCYPLLSLSLRREGPATHHRATRHPLRKPVLVRQCDQGLCLLSGRLYLTTESVQPHRTLQGVRQTIWVRQLLCQGEPVTASLQGLVWIAQQPEWPGHQEAIHPR